MSPATSNFRICIVGGGIGGLTALIRNMPLANDRAIFLRSEGREIVVLEQSRMLKEVGAAISLQPNASGIFERLGLGEDLKKAGGIIDNGFQIFRTDGIRQLQVPSKRETNNGYDRILFHRVDLHGMLKDVATREDSEKGPAATLRLGSRVASCDCEQGTISLESGEELGPFDLIIGADGIHSKIRDSVLGEHVDPIPTGLSAYRLSVSCESRASYSRAWTDVAPLITPKIPRDNIKDLPHAYAQCTQEPWTSMLVGQACRAIMGPCRNGELLSIVALVPDDQLHEQSTDSWTSSGSLEHLLESFAAFPEWTKTLFSRSPSLGLWQLRDLDPLSRWNKGRVILIGDAAHAMLPTQGQGASQSIEDAEALGAFFKGISSQPSKSEVEAVLKRVYDVRHERATLLQKYSRQQGKPAANSETLEVTLNPAEFHAYNVGYNGAVEWEKKMASENALATAT
ncbi:BQ5605_C013g07343 [Microbotryum silenes-dioicae]|uniref:BQ5605_C013g07343 protein n=1 Tax=Microbotryum silenes-dioicae TaxID=796604 RepID=A0A2X0NP13_9BASI|nr:BQ5605_C013g07343 [Microbotryum silenes-dioicae]